MVKKSENLKKSEKISKNHFFSKKKNFERKKMFAEKRKKHAIPLVLPIEEISLRPELSSQPRFRIQGGTLSVTEQDGGGGGAGNPRF